jgi:hypothetical protein
MSGTARELRGAAYALAVAGALAFGVTTARAEARSWSECDDPAAVGACNSDSTCVTLCRSLGFTTAYCRVADRCCFCDAD